MIEGVEGWGQSLLLGVQWHAETLVDDAEQLALFAPARDGLRGSASAAARAGGARKRGGARDRRGARPETVSPPDGREAPAWGRWPAAAGQHPWTVGIEEEVMLLHPTDWALASRIDASCRR